MRIEEDIKNEIIEFLKKGHQSALAISKEIKEGYYKTMFYLELMKNEGTLELIPTAKHTYHWGIKK